MLEVSGRRVDVYDRHKALVPNVCTIGGFEDGLKLGGTGRAYLRSIVEAKKSLHVYADLHDLGWTLRMRDRTLEAARTVAANIAFWQASRAQPKWAESSPSPLDPRYWRLDPTRQLLECRTNDHARALSALVDRTVYLSRLECKAISQVIAILALLRAFSAATPNADAARARFNHVVDARLAASNRARSGAPGAKIRLSVPLRRELLQSENLVNSGAYVGDWRFRPGDLVAVANGMPEAAENYAARIWMVENGVCIGWKADAKGQPLYDQPLFVGGGLWDDRGEPRVLTEAELKEAVFEETANAAGIPILRTPYKDVDERMKWFSRTTLLKHEALAEERKKKPGAEMQRTPDGIPDIELAPTVDRLALLGGRNDVY